MFYVYLAGAVCHWIVWTHWSIALNELLYIFLISPQILLLLTNQFTINRFADFIHVCLLFNKLSFKHHVMCFWLLLKGMKIWLKVMYSKVYVLPSITIALHNTHTALRCSAIYSFWFAPSTIVENTSTLQNTKMHMPCVALLCFEKKDTCLNSV